MTILYLFQEDHGKAVDLDAEHNDEEGERDVGDDGDEGGALRWRRGSPRGSRNQRHAEKASISWHHFFRANCLGVVELCGISRTLDPWKSGKPHAEGGLHHLNNI